MEPQHEDFVRSGWVLAIALLGLETLSGIVRQAFARGLIDPMVMRYDDFRRDLARTLADPERLAGLRRDRLAPLEDAIGELSGWYAFSGAVKRGQQRRARGRRAAPPPAPPPLAHPLQKVRPGDTPPSRRREE